MIHEKIKINEKSTSLKIENTKIISVRKKDITKNGYRVYKDGYIGITGYVGEADDSDLKAKAIQSLDTKMKYPYPVEKGLQQSVDIDICTVNHRTLIRETEKILDFLQNEYPHFIFSETAMLMEQTITFENSLGQDLSYKDSYVELGLILKEDTSANIFDGFISYQGRKFDADKFIDFNRIVLNAYSTNISMPVEEKLPIIFVNNSEIINKLMESLNGEKYGNGSSLLAGKLNEQVFNEKLTVIQDYDPVRTYNSFFDSEGVVEENFTVDLVKNGKFEKCYTNKKIADMYGLEHTGAATSEYDGVPKLGSVHLTLEKDSINIKDNIGQKAIVCMISAGGDFTDDGTFATPVQIAFLYDGEKIVGKLPEFQLRSHFFRMFGEDYVGTFESPFYLGDDDRVTIIEMDIVKN